MGGSPSTCSVVISSFILVQDCVCGVFRYIRANNVKICEILIDMSVQAPHNQLRSDPPKVYQHIVVRIYNLPQAVKYNIACPS